MSSRPRASKLRDGQALSAAELVCCAPLSRLGFENTRQIFRYEMAAQMATMSGHVAKGVVLPEEAIGIVSTELPGGKDRIFDIDLGLLTLNG
jgi:hypothetical protein